MSKLWSMNLDEKSIRTEGSSTTAATRDKVVVG